MHAELEAPFPSDAWHEGRWGFFAFDLRHENGESGEGKLRLVIFAVDLLQRKLEAAKVVTIDTHVAKAEVEDLLAAGVRFSIPVRDRW